VRRVEKEPEHAVRPLIAPQEVPLAVHHERGIRFLLLKHELQRLLRRAHFGGGEDCPAIHRGIARRPPPPVSLARRGIEAGGHEEDHVTARLRAPGFEETEMTGRDIGLQSEGQLAQLACRPPLPQQGAKRGCGGYGCRWAHGMSLLSTCSVAYRQGHDHYL